MVSERVIQGSCRILGDGSGKRDEIVIGAGHTALASTGLEPFSDTLVVGVAFER